MVKYTMVDQDTCIACGACAVQQRQTYLIITMKEFPLGYP